MPPRQQAIDRFAYSRNGGGNADEGCVIRVSIPIVTTDAQHTRYTIEVTNLQTRQTWQTSHRYSEFLKLRNDITQYFEKADRKCPGCVNYEKVLGLFEFPSKHVFTSKNPVVINYRKKGLRAFLSLLASHTFTTAPKCPTCSALPFTAVRDFLTEQVEAPAGSTSPTGGSIDRDTIRESINVKDFTAYVPVGRVKAVNSEGVFVNGSKSSKRNTAKSSKPSAAAPPPAPAATTAATTAPPAPASTGAPRKLKFGAKEPADLPPSPASSTSSSTGDLANFPISPVSADESVPLPKSPRQGNDEKQKRGSSHPPLQSQQSTKEDEEFGSLNMDFMKSVAMSREEEL